MKTLPWWFLGAVLMLLPTLGRGEATQAVKGMAGDFRLTFQSRDGSGDTPLWEVKAEGRFFVGGGWFLAESNYAMPGGQTEEKVVFLGNGGEDEFYLVFPGTLNYQILLFDDERARVLSSILQRLAQPTVKEMRVAAGELGKSLSSLGKRAVEGEPLDGYTLSDRTSASDELLGDMAVRLYFQPAKGTLRVVEIEDAERTVWIMIGKLRRGEMPVERLQVPDGYYVMPPRDMRHGGRGKTETVQE